MVQLVFPVSWCFILYLQMLTPEKAQNASQSSFPISFFTLGLFEMFPCEPIPRIKSPQTKLEWQIGLGCSAALRPLLSSSGRLPKETVHVSTKANSKSLGYQSFGSKSGAIRSLEAHKVEKPPYSHWVNLIGYSIHGCLLQKQILVKAVP